ncbi:MAG TPA: nuclear transport factor 2 family protein [Lapillicoccus sp.]|nr:nuclear transport factor 2 family protein [Lapillicoccus sp.]
MKEGDPMTSSPHGGDDHDAAALITDTEEAANAWMQGDMDRYLALIHHARGFTLTPPNGGPPQQFADRRKEFEGWQSPFSDGEAALEITAAHAWGDTAVLVMIERQHGRIADLPDQDLSMRVTQIYRWTPSGWEMVHRHADPLTRPLSDEQLRSLAGGEAHRASDPP